MSGETIFHIDVNSAYLSWSAIRRLQNGDPLDLRTIPSIIGGDQEKRHGIVLAKSIPAKKYGIQTAETIVSAFRKCPTLVMESPDMHYYHQKSEELMNYLRSVCPDIEQLSVDECFMDYTPIRHRYASPIEAAFHIKDEIRNRFGFTVNVGISDKRVLAKMASDFEKPDKVHTLYQHEIKEKMWPLPVSSLYMCGKSSVQALHNLGIRTIGDLATTDVSIIASHLKSHGVLLWQYANGIDDSGVTSVPAEAKGIGNSTTVAKDLTTANEAYPILLSLCESVGERLRHASQSASMVSVEIKYADFRNASHQRNLPEPTNATTLLYRNSCQLFDELWNGSPIRLLGVRTTKLSDMDAPVQLSLFDRISDQPEKNTGPSREKLDALDNALDAIRNKYGKDAIVRGSLLSSKEKR